MAVFARFGEPGVLHQPGRAGPDSENNGLEERVKNLRKLEDLLRKEAPDFLVIHELVQRRKLAELELFNLARQAVAALESRDVEGGVSNDQNISHGSCRGTWQEDGYSVPCEAEAGHILCWRFPSY